MASDPLYAEDEMELTSSEINLPHNLDEMASSLEHDQDQYVMQQAWALQQKSSSRWIIISNSDLL